MKQLVTINPTSTPVTVEITIPDTLLVSQSGGTPIDTIPVNQIPTADAGSDVTITLPNNSVILSGRGSDPEGKAVTFNWTKVSGSGNLLSPNAASCEVVNLTEGASTFRLTVTDDKGATKTDDVNITVRAEVVITVGQYEGFGSQAKGGEGQQIVKVTNLNSSGAGSLASAIGSNRTIVFDVSGTIKGRFDLIGISYMTIDGAGKDITIDNGNNGDGISFDGSNTHHCILKNIRVINAGNDNINVLDGAHDIVIDHCSSYDAADGCIDVAGGKNVTVSYCLLGRGKSGWSGDMLITAQNVTVHHCLFYPATSGGVGERCPFVHSNYTTPGSPCVDFRNNVVMNFGRSGGTGSGYGTAIAYNATGNVVNNYYYDKESAASSVCNGDGYGSGATGKLFSSGNYITNGASQLSSSMANNHAEFIIADQYKISMQLPLDAAKKVKSEVGTEVKNSYELSLINAINA